MTKIDDNNCSGIKDGHAWTKGDLDTIDSLEPEEREKLLKWIDEFIYGRTTANKKWHSGNVKHIAEKALGFYITNNCMKDAMLAAGYKPVNERHLNWCWKISEKSPAFKS